ncbi:hypothetical protein GmHk_19G055685 [Glycine max]|uniref:Uncharacterized protein n=1 Tax=Glycine soja TaxID=3848 RepID=A0A445FHK5_GLYSO|nr:hypothetical protein GmHk_19G055685 [Glycine max]RZB48325.1 hypothetical protein D0Y65_051724 [Glycine soja]
MDSNFKHDSFEYINLDGKNVGATMRLQHRSSKGESKDCCCINIYVNNNVQGVSNSVLHGSEVRMRDPGVSLYFENLKVDKGTPSSNKTLCWDSGSPLQDEDRSLAPNRKTVFHHSGW